MKPLIRSTDAGFTLLETLVALSLFAIVTAGMIPAFVAHLRINHRSELKTGAIQAAQVVLEALRRQNPETLPTNGFSETRTVSAGERDYQVDVDYCTVTTYCSARSRFVELSVSHQEEVLYEVSTVFTRLR